MGVLQIAKINRFERFEIPGFFGEAGDLSIQGNAKNRILNINY
jgi:hypothetical protein